MTYLRLMSKVKLTVEFDNQAALEHFAGWLCNQGEQGYWECMRYREQEEPGDITATGFHYHGPEENLSNIPKNKPTPFMPDNIIRTTCGRLSKGESTTSPFSRYGDEDEEDNE